MIKAMREGISCICVFVCLQHTGKPTSRLACSYYSCDWIVCFFADRVSGGCVPDTRPQTVTGAGELSGPVLILRPVLSYVTIYIEFPCSGKGLHTFHLPLCVLLTSQALRRSAYCALWYNLSRSHFSPYWTASATSRGYVFLGCVVQSCHLKAITICSAETALVPGPFLIPDKRPCRSQGRVLHELNNPHSRV